MVASIPKPKIKIPTPEPDSIPTLEAFLNCPLDSMEWVDGQLVEKLNMTLRHSQVQSRLDYSWRSYMLSSNQGGEVYTEALCRTNRQGRRPDVAYLTPELQAQYAGAASLPMSFPLIAEVASPEDSGEDLFAKAAEYLQSGAQEVWLIYPESRWIVILTAEKHLLLTVGDIASTQSVLLGFSIPVDELLAD